MNILGIGNAIVDVICKVDDSFINKNGQLNSGWTPYLYDVAFQKYVIQRCHPNWHIKAYLMLADKSAIATVDGLNQFFRISKKENFLIISIFPMGRFLFFVYSFIKPIKL